MPNLDCEYCRGSGCDPLSDTTNSIPCSSCRGAGKKPGTRKADGWVSVGWLIKREDGSHEVVIGALTNDTYLGEGDEAVPMAVPQPPVKEK